jgi:hypothetical protein
MVTMILRVSSVDERDARVEWDAVSYRVVLFQPCHRRETFDAEGCTVAELESWARDKNPGGQFRMALRMLSDDGLSLV